MFFGPASYRAFLACTVIHSIATAGAEALLPFYMKSLGTSTALAGLPFIANSLARFFSDPFSGAISDRLSSRSFILLSLLLGAGFSLLAGASTKPTLFLSFWIFIGVSESMFALGIRKVAFESARPGSEGSTVGNITTLYGIGSVLGPPVAGYLGSQWGTRVLFLIYALPLFLGIALCWLFPLSSSAKNLQAYPKKRSLFREGRELLYLPAFLAACLGMFFMFFSHWGAMKVALPLFAVEERGLTLADVGTILGIAGVVDILGRYTGGLSCDRWGARRAIQWALLISALSFALVNLAPGYGGLLASACGMALGHGFLNVTSTMLALKAAEENRGGLALGLARWFGSAGSISGPFLIGILAEALSYGMVFFFLGIFALGLVGWLKLWLLKSLSP